MAASAGRLLDAGHARISISRPGIGVEAGAWRQLHARVDQKGGGPQLRRGAERDLRSAFALAHAAAQVPVALVVARQEARQLGQGHFIDAALELHDDVQRNPVIVPAPGIELWVVGRPEVQIPVVADQLEQEPDLLLALVVAACVTADVPVWHLVAQPVPCAGHHADVARLQPDLLVQFTEHGLLGSLPSINATLRELPAVGADPLAPEHLVPLVEQDDADVGPKTVPVEHNLTPIFKTVSIMHGHGCAASVPARMVNSLVQ